MSSQRFTSARKADPLPPLSPSPPRSSTTRESHFLTDDADRTHMSLPLPHTRGLTSFISDASMDGIVHPSPHPPTTLNNNNSASVHAHTMGNAEVSANNASQFLSTSTPTPPLRGAVSGGVGRGGAPPLSCSTLNLPNSSSMLRSPAQELTDAVAELQSGTSINTNTTIPTTTRSRASAEKNASLGAAGATSTTAPTSTSAGAGGTTSTAVAEGEAAAPHLQKVPQRTPSGTSGGSVSVHPNHVASAANRTVVFSSSEHQPHMPTTQHDPRLLSTSTSTAAGAALSTTAITTTHVPSSMNAGLGGGGGASTSPNGCAPPHEGIFLQPSTFRIGATGEDVLWALYQTNGVIANYLDQPPAIPSTSAIPNTTATNAKARSCVTKTNNDSVHEDRLKPRSSGTSVASSAPAVQSTAPTSPSAARRSSSNSGRHHSDHAKITLPTPIATTSAAAAAMNLSTAAQDHPNCSNLNNTTNINSKGITGNNNNNNSSSSTTGAGGGGGGGQPSFVDVQAEIARCLNGAGGSTPCLLSFDYVIRPARSRHFSDEELSRLRRDPIVLELSAAQVNKLEEVVHTAPRPNVFRRKVKPPTSDGSEESFADADGGGDEAGNAGRSTSAAATMSALRGHEVSSDATLEQQKKAWLQQISESNTDVEARTAESELQLRRRACGEVVQACLFAARRASSSTRSKLYLCEMLPSDASKSFITQGTLHHVLSGSAVSEGARLMPSPLWNGIQIALSTMLTGEEASFLIASDDSTRFWAPRDGTTYTRAGLTATSTTAAATSTAASSTVGSSFGVSGMGASLSAWQNPRSTTPTITTTPTRTPTVNFNTDDHRAMTFQTPHSTRHRRSSRRHSGERTPRSRSNSASSRRGSASAASTSAITSPASSRASSTDRGASPRTHPPQQQQPPRHRRTSASPQQQSQPQKQQAQTPTQQQQQQQQRQQQQQPSSPPQSKSSKFLSKVREWRKKGRHSSAEEKEKAKEKEKEKEKEKNKEKSKSSTGHAGEASSPAPPPHTSPTRTYPQSHRHGAHTSRLPGHTTEVPVTANLGMVQPTPRPPQRVRSFSHCENGCGTGGGNSPAPLPSFSPSAPADVLAYEAATYGSVEPLLVCLRLRERIPLLPTRSTSMQPTLLVSAESLIPATPTELPQQQQRVGEAGEGSPDGSSATPTPPTTASSDPFLRSTSNLSAGALSASTAATSTMSESLRRRNIMTDALLCLRESNVMRASLATAFHHIARASLSADGGRGRRRSSCSGRSASTPRASSSSPRSAGRSTLAHMMLSVLDSADVRNGARTALFTAMTYVMDGKLLNTRDRAHVLESRGAGARVESGGVARGTAAAAAAAAGVVERATPPETDVNALTISTATSAAPPLSPPPPPPQPLAPSSPSQVSAPLYVWLPCFRVSDAVATFARYWHSGAFNKSRGFGNHGSTISGRALQRTLDEFTSYAHDTCTVTYSISVYNAATQTYLPYVYPLRLANTQSNTTTTTNGSAGPASPLGTMSAAAAAAAATNTATGEAAPSVIRSAVGCVVHPCWLDAVLQSGRHRRGTDVHVVTRGYAAESDERLFVCAVLSDITATSQDAASAFAPHTPRATSSTAAASSSPLAAASASHTHTYAEGEGRAGRRGSTVAKSRTPLENPASPKAPTTPPSGVSTRPTTATTAAALLTATQKNTTSLTHSPTTTTHTATPAGATRSKSKTAPPPPLLAAASLLVKSSDTPASAAAAASTTHTHVDGVANMTDKADAVARRSLAASKQLLKRRVSEQRFCVRVHSCEPVLTPQHFYANSQKEGLAAARALLVDAAVLLDYYYRVMEQLTQSSLRGGDGSTLSYAYSPAIRSLRLSAVVPSALYKSSRLIHRAQHSRQRLPYLLFGEDRSAILAAATARAQAMGFSSTTSSSSAFSAARPTNTDATCVPPIDVVAAALMLFSPTAASSATTLTSRIPLALERILLKVMPMLYLAIFLLTFGVEEADAVPGEALDGTYGAWWLRAMGGHGKGEDTTKKTKQSHSRQTPAESTIDAAATATPLRNGVDPRAAKHEAENEDHAPPPPHPKLFATQPLNDTEKNNYRRYTYLGECFHFLAFLYAELPGVRSMSWEACTMALFYFPRDASLWSLWAVLSTRLGNTGDARTAQRVAVQLLTLEEEEEQEARDSAASTTASAAAAEGKESLSSGSTGHGKLDSGAEAPMMSVETMSNRLGRVALAQYLQEQL